MVTGGWSLLIAAAVGAQARTEEPSDKHQPPFTVFVFANPTGEPEKDRDLFQATAVVRKRIAARKPWFKVAAGPKAAAIVVEVQAHSLKESLTIYASTDTMRGQIQGASRYAITQHHFLDARVTLLGEELRLKGADTSRNGSLKGAASALAWELEKQCQKHYREPRCPSSWAWRYCLARRALISCSSLAGEVEGLKPT